MKRLWRVLRLAIVAAAGIAYVLIGYLASATRHPPLFAVLVGAVPFAAGLIAACWRSRLRIPSLALCTAAFVAAGLNIDRLLGHASWLYFIQHFGAMSSLCVMFGATLGSHESALCSCIARFAVAEELDARYLRYTWYVTLAWTLYFLASALVSATLFLCAPLADWALFAAVLTPVSLGAMFVGEFLIRLRALPGRPHFSIAQTIRSYRQYTRGDTALRPASRQP
jgi:uncharacterized membrane protein